MILARTVYLVPGMPNALFFISRGSCFGGCCFSEEIDLEEIARPLYSICFGADGTKRRKYGHGSPAMFLFGGGGVMEKTEKEKRRWIVER